MLSVTMFLLAGETETRVDIQTIELEGMTLRIVSPLNAPTLLPTIIYYYGGCFVSGGFATHDNQLRQLAYYGQCRVIAVQSAVSSLVLPEPMISKPPVLR